LKGRRGIITGLRNEFGLCYFNAFVIQSSTDAKNHIKPITVVTNARQLFFDFYNITDGVNKKIRRTLKNEALFAYRGLEESTELKRLCEFTTSNLNIYVSDPVYGKRSIGGVAHKQVKRSFSLHQQVKIDPTYKTVSVLRIQHNGCFHVFPITDF